MTLKTSAPENAPNSAAEAADRLHAALDQFEAYLDEKGKADLAAPISALQAAARLALKER
jgi:hypothetical protein